MRISFIGISGLFNYGCEAIIRGAIVYFKNTHKNAKFTYYSFNYKDDKKSLSDLEIDIIKIKPNRNLFFRLLNKALSFLRINFRFGIGYTKEIIKRSDIIVSVGGDLYTIPKVYQNNKRANVYNSLIQFGNRILRHKKEYIIYGASIGPFGTIKKNKNYYLSHLKKVTKIICREYVTIDYLAKNGVSDNVAFSPDPAFLLSSHNYSHSKDYIGLNFSELSIRECFGDSFDAVKFVSDVVKDILKKQSKAIMFLPHVINPLNERDNDLLFLKKVFEEVPVDLKNRIVFADGKGYIGIKKDLHKCAIVASCRMHCAINSLTEGIPCIFVVYSQKAFGMANLFYGNDEWSIKLEELKDKLSDMILKKNVDVIQDKIIERCRELEAISLLDPRND